MMRACSDCGSTRFGLIRHRWGVHQFCRRACMERYKRRLEAEVKRRKFLVWLSSSARTTLPVRKHSHSPK
jgi:hypothetical protein